MFGSIGSRLGRRDRISPNLSSIQQAFERLRLSIGQTGVPMVPTHRLTLATGVPVTESDLTGQTTIYLTPSGNDLVQIYDGYNWPAYQVSEQSLALDSNSGHTGYQQSGKNFFLGMFIHPGTGVLKFGSSVAWSSDTATGTGAGTCEVELFQGRLVNKVSMVVRFGSASADTATVPARQFVIFGGFRASADGQTTDSLAKRYVSNLQNPTIRALKAVDATTNYVYTTATARQANADSANQFEVFHCVAGRSTLVDAFTTFSATAGAPQCAIGIDSTSVVSGWAGNINGNSTNLFTLFAKYNGFAGIGKHYFARLESGGGSGTTTWYSNSGLNSQLIGQTLN